MSRHSSKSAVGGNVERWAETVDVRRRYDHTILDGLVIM